MANFEPKEFNASDINGGQKFNAGDGITPEAINAPIESALLMQRLATTQPQLIEDGGATSVSIDTTNNKFVFKNIKGEKGEQGPQGYGAPSNMSQNANKTIIVDGSVVNGNWNATFIVRQGGKQRPICTQYTDHTGAKAEMVTTANSAKFKFVNGSTDPQAYIEIFEDKINFSKPITVQDNPVGGGGNSSALLYMSNMSGYGAYELYFALPKDFSNVKEIKIKYTQQYDNYNYNVITNNADVVIYNEQQGFLTPTLRGLLSDAYSSTETYDVSTRWDTEGISANIFTLDFYNATGGSGGNAVYILFEIQYK